MTLRCQGCGFVFVPTAADEPCAKCRAEKLEAALRRAEPFTRPEIRRGPAIDEWMFMRRDVARALDIPLDEWGFTVELL